MHPLDDSDIHGLFNTLKQWEDIFNSEAERFTGDILLSCEDDLLQLCTCVDLWAESGVSIFANHPVQDGGLHVQHAAMLELKTKVERLHTEFKLRMSGENGIAKGIIQFINALDTWYWVLLILSCFLRFPFV